MTSTPPIIGCTTYRKRVPQTRPIDVYGLMPSYTEAISAAGGIPLLIPMGLSERDLVVLLERLDGIVLPGGGDVDPTAYGGHTNGSVSEVDLERDRTELFLARTAVTNRKPILAICRGLQVLNVALAGTLWEDITSKIAGAMDHDLPDHLPLNHLSHTVTIEAESRLDRLMGKHKGWVNSFHHQAIRDVAFDLHVTASAADGVIEAAEIREHPFAIGVQWHPENLIHDDEAMLSLFKGLVHASTNEHALVR
jgi:putative glutamine amidotransferase